MRLIELQHQNLRGIVDFNGRVAELVRQGREATTYADMWVYMDLKRCRPCKLLALKLKEAVKQVKGIGQRIEFALRK